MLPDRVDAFGTGYAYGTIDGHTPGFSRTRRRRNAAPTPLQQVGCKPVTL